MMTGRERMEYERTHWTLDRRIPIALLVTIMIQFGGAVWFISRLDNRIGDNEARIVILEQRSAANESSRNILDGRITRIEEKLSFQTQLLQEIRSLLSGRPSQR